MRKLLVVSSFACLSLSSIAFLACSGDDTDAGPRDAGKDVTAYDGPLLDSALPPQDGDDDGDGGDGGAVSPQPPYLLLSYNYDNYSKTEYSAFSLTTGAVAGNLQYAKYGTNMSGG